MSSKEFCGIFICISKVLDRFLYSEHPFGCSGKSSVKSSVFFTLNNIFPTPARDGLCIYFTGKLQAVVCGTYKCSKTALIFFRYRILWRS